MTDPRQPTVTPVDGERGDGAVFELDAMERVAIAIFMQKNGKQAKWETFPAGYKKGYRELADAAIAAMDQASATAIATLRTKLEAAERERDGLRSECADYAREIVGLRAIASRVNDGVSFGDAVYQFHGRIEQAEAHVLGDHIRGWLLGKEEIPE